jgi:hypothetical protein
LRIFKNGWFQRFARKQDISDQILREAVLRAGAGQVDADLEGGVIKQRVARAGSGRSGGYRTIIPFRAGDRTVFVFGFAKKDRANIDADELAAFRRAAREVLALGKTQLDELIRIGRFVEVRSDDGEEVS